MYLEDKYCYEAVADLVPSIILKPGSKAGPCKQTSMDKICTCTLMGISQLVLCIKAEPIIIFITSQPTSRGGRSFSLAMRLAASVDLWQSAGLQARATNVHFTYRRRGLCGL